MGMQFGNEVEESGMKQIFRLTHFSNLPFILQHGIHCPNSAVKDPEFTPIGFRTLIDYRNDRAVPIEPGGTLADYVPFYFWYRSPMLYVIYKGNNPEVYKTPQHEVVYLVSSTTALLENNCGFIFTDRHAKLEYANFYEDPAKLTQLNWDIIKSEQWGAQHGQERREIKQAECLVHRAVPCDAITGIAVANPDMESVVNTILSEKNIDIPVKVKTNFYF